MLPPGFARRPAHLGTITMAVKLEIVGRDACRVGIAPQALEYD
jgi:hypothetical protein